MSEYPTITAAIKKISKETDKATTYELDYKLNAEPGQFIMLWIPGKGERPMGIADNEPMTITVAHVGQFTEEMRKLKEGDLVSFRGPMGHGFKLDKNLKNILLVAGGTGVVPVHLLAKKAKKEGLGVYTVLGAKTKKEICYKKRFAELSDEVLVTTDDGSEGFKGNAVQGAEKILKENKINAVYSCGPEIMMKFLAELCKKEEIPCQLSLERYMKCGLGICGSCMIGNKMVCKDGPVFSGEEALGFKEFGKMKRDASGKPIKL